MEVPPKAPVPGPLPDSETTVRVLVRHLPTFLSEEALREFFAHYGCAAVASRLLTRTGADTHQYFNSGKMAGAAILAFRDADRGAAAYQQLSGLELFGKKLRVEYVRRPPRKEFKKREPFPGIAPDLGDPTLEYTYPDATPTIVNNISQALLRVPRFYTQVLHLMNKMNLPPPFGTPASYNPLLIKSKRKKQASGAQAAPAVASPAAAQMRPLANDDLSSSESELESDNETNSSKRPRPTLSSAEFERQMREAKAEVIKAAPIVAAATATAPTVPIPRQVHPPIAVSAPPPHYPTLPPLQSPLPVNSISALSSSAIQQPTVPAAAQPSAPPTSRAFLNNEDLKQRVTLDELRQSHKWTETPPHSKLYIRNLPKDATTADLEIIFGRYFSSEHDMRSGLDIKVMDGKMKGSAFVGFQSLELAQQAHTELNGVIFRGQPLVILFGKKDKQ